MTRPQELNESHEAHADGDAAGEEENEVYGSHMGSGSLHGEESEQHGHHGKHGAARRGIHIASSFNA
jgi:hypothetical protein